MGWRRLESREEQTEGTRTVRTSELWRLNMMGIMLLYSGKCNGERIVIHLSPSFLSFVEFYPYHSFIMQIYKELDSCLTSFDV